jgi:t-SNARE complex subunit (syntaxin)
MTHQAENQQLQEENVKYIQRELEAQRHEIVETVEDINDIMVLVSQLRDERVFCCMISWNLMIIRILY